MRAAVGWGWQARSWWPLARDGCHCGCRRGLQLGEAVFGVGGVVGADAPVASAFPFVAKVAARALAMSWGALISADMGKGARVRLVVEVSRGG